MSSYEFYLFKNNNIDCKYMHKELQNLTCNFLWMELSFYSLPKPIKPLKTLQVYGTFGKYATYDAYLTWVITYS